MHLLFLHRHNPRREVNGQVAAHEHRLLLRVWRATYAGVDAGSIVVIVEVPNLAGIAKVEDTIRTNPDLAAEMKKINAMRKIVSDSLYEALSH